MAGTRHSSMSPGPTIASWRRTNTVKVRFHKGDASCDIVHYVNGSLTSAQPATAHGGHRTVLARKVPIDARDLVEPSMKPHMRH